MRRISWIALVAIVLGNLSAELALAQFKYQQLKSFGSSDVSRGFFVQGLIQGSDGKLYGTTYDGGPSNVGTVFRIGPDGNGYLLLHSFGQTDQDGQYPVSAVLEGSDGRLYGSTAGGGSGAEGTAFKLNKDGSGYTVFYAFTNSPGEGFGPTALLEGGDGVLYGLTQSGGISYAGGGSFGTIFKLNKDGTGYAVLHSFSKPEGGGANGLATGEFGKLYGITRGGGITNDAQPDGMGTMFTLDVATRSYTVLHQFTGHTNEGLRPTSLFQSPDGALYGTTENGGMIGEGTVFKLHTDGTGFAVLHSFSSLDGGYFPQTLLQAGDGALYGSAEFAQSPYESGALFKLHRDGSGYTVLRYFWGTGGVAAPTELLQGQDGALYGASIGSSPDGASKLYTLNTDGSGFSVLLFLNGTGDDGGHPMAPLVEGDDHALYGTTVSGGTNGLGTVFKIRHDGSGYQLLHQFEFGRDDGAHPALGLVRGGDGALYGTTLDGGTTNAGTIFKINQDGSGYAVLFSFTATNGQSIGPLALTLGGDGALYGITSNGGIPGEYFPSGWGTVFRINKDGEAYTILYSFQGPPNDAFSPYSLLVASDGRLYGTAAGGGTNNAGCVFKLNKDGSAYQVLYRFAAAGDVSPAYTLMEGSDGALYGTASGTNTVFKLNKDGSGFNTLASFPLAYDIFPFPGLIQASDGVLYCTTTGAYIFYGLLPATVFRLNPNGTGYEVLYSFDQVGDLVGPSGLIQGSDGALYATTQYGGDRGFGSIFTLRPQGTLLAPVLSSAGMRVRFTSMPGSRHELQRASTPQGTWMSLTNLVVPGNGMAEFDDTSPPPDAAFYRLLTR